MSSEARVNELIETMVTIDLADAPTFASQTAPERTAGEGIDPEFGTRWRFAGGAFQFFEDGHWRGTLDRPATVIRVTPARIAMLASLLPSTEVR